MPCCAHGLVKKITLNMHQDTQEYTPYYNDPLEGEDVYQELEDKIEAWCDENFYRKSDVFEDCKGLFVFDFTDGGRKTKRYLELE